MEKVVYDFKLNLSWKLLRTISQIDRFDASWSSIERKEGQNLKQLRTMATIQSIGSSTRIEGSKMSDKEVEVLLNNMDISKIEDRDSQEVVGYSNVLNLIISSYADLEIGESNIKSLHNVLLKMSNKDGWHRGAYKQHSNAVEAKFPYGSRQIIFRTTDPGYATEGAMRRLVRWFEEEKEVHPLIIAASFAYDFVSIHPFQDGNGRMSRLLTTLLLLKFGYSWIEYVSFEHEIENKKKDYYRSLRNCQADRPNEDITDWIEFFMKSLLSIQNKLDKKLEWSGILTELSLKEKEVYMFIENNAGCKSGIISQKLGIPISSAKRIVTTLVSKELVQRYGKGAGTYYIVK